MHIGQEVEDLNPDEWQIHGMHALRTQDHSLNNMPICRHCRVKLTNWHAFRVHILTSCPVLHSGTASVFLEPARQSSALSEQLSLGSASALCPLPSPSALCPPLPCSALPSCPLCPLCPLPPLPPLPEASALSCFSTSGCYRGTWDPRGYSQGALQSRQWNVCLGDNVCIRKSLSNGSEEMR